MLAFGFHHMRIRKGFNALCGKHGVCIACVFCAIHTVFHFCNAAYIIANLRADYKAYGGGPCAFAHGCVAPRAVVQHNGFNRGRLAVFFHGNGLGLRHFAVCGFQRHVDDAFALGSNGRVLGHNRFGKAVLRVHLYIRYKPARIVFLFAAQHIPFAGIYFAIHLYSIGYGLAFMIIVIRRQAHA